MVCSNRISNLCDIYKYLSNPMWYIKSISVFRTINVILFGFWMFLKWITQKINHIISEDY